VDSSTDNNKERMHRRGEANQGASRQDNVPHAGEAVVRFSYGRAIHIYAVVPSWFDLNE